MMWVVVLVRVLKVSAVGGLVAVAWVELKVHRWVQARVKGLAWGTRRQWRLAWMWERWAQRAVGLAVAWAKLQG